MNIIGVESLVYGSEDVTAAIKFHEDWGLEPTEKGKSGADFKLPDDTTVHVRAIDAATLGAGIDGPRGDLGSRGQGLTRCDRC